VRRSEQDRAEAGGGEQRRGHGSGAAFPFCAGNVNTGWKLTQIDADIGDGLAEVLKVNSGVNRARARWGRGMTGNECF
jgi:hypothetical protein